MLKEVRGPMRTDQGKRRLRLLPRTIRMRLTVLFGGLFLLSAFFLLAITNSVGRSTSVAVAQPHRAGAQNPAGQIAANNATQQHFLIGSVIALCVMVVVAFFLGWLISGRALRPVRVMTAATRRISADNLHERLALQGPQDELKDLGDTIDGLLERLEGAFAAQRRFVANASHELRTPLATMRASVDVAEAKPGSVPAPTLALATRLRAELDRLDGLLDGLLALARVQHGELPGASTVSLSQIAAAALEARADAIAASGLAVSQLSSPGDSWISGSQPLLTRMVDNVIDNAITHNEQSGWIRVLTAADGAMARIVIDNGGELLDPARVAELGQPFRRLSVDRIGSDRGAGLGLSIVAAIVAAHRGTMTLQARADGGLTVSICLPLATSPALEEVPA
jgi:signal transduction histidine kinase